MVLKAELLCYMFLSVFTGFDRAQSTTVLKCVGQLTNRKVPLKIFSCSHKIAASLIAALKIARFHNFN